MKTNILNIDRSHVCVCVCDVCIYTHRSVTLGTPIAVIVRNKDQRSKDYTEMDIAYRPSHADMTYDAKYGVRAVAGGGRSSARETIGRCAMCMCEREDDDVSDRWGGCWYQMMFMYERVM